MIKDRRGGNTKPHIHDSSLAFLLFSGVVGGSTGSGKGSEELENIITNENIITFSGDWP